jgi:methionine synthase I (cobalamin-dependent)
VHGVQPADAGRIRPEVEAAFRTQMAALASEGVELFLLETFST